MSAIEMSPAPHFFAKKICICGNSSGVRRGSTRSGRRCAGWWDCCFAVSEFPIRVGRQDFAPDLLFFHHGLNALL